MYIWNDITQAHAGICGIPRFARLGRREFNGGGQGGLMEGNKGAILLHSMFFTCRASRIFTVGQ